MSEQTTRPIEEIRQEKLRKLEAIRAKGINPYPAGMEFEITKAADAMAQPEGTELSVAGRIRSIRGHGKIRFLDIADQSGNIQAALKFDVVGEELFELFHLIDAGDFVEINGVLFVTNTGELTIEVHKANLLSKALRPLPDNWEGLSDKETRYRKRYLDLLTNEEAQKVFETRHTITREIRNFLQNKGFTEVDIPILQPLYGGANAKPFTTYIHALDTEAYLRIASELYLKRLIVGGIESVFDIARDFRNEGIDQTHYPEFTMLETYLPYADYHGMMDLIEEMTHHLAQQLNSEMIFQVHDKSVNLNQEWPRIAMTDLIKDRLGFDALDKSVAELRAIAQEHKLDVTDSMPKGEVTFLLFDKLISKTLIEPTWVIDYPIEISPFSKQHRSKEGFVERFELYIGGVELFDGWSEINDPIEQHRRFEAESYRQLGEGEAAQPMDEDFLEAMEYGMPPVAGLGVGIERLTMFFTNTWVIQETILFPFKKIAQSTQKKPSLEEHTNIDNVQY